MLSVLHRGDVVARRKLADGVQLSIGRSDWANWTTEEDTSLLRSVSAAQVQVSLARGVRGALSAHLTSVGRNPTLALPNGGAPGSLLATGESSELSEGATFALCLEDTQFARLQFSWAATSNEADFVQSHLTASGAAELGEDAEREEAQPPAKLPRSASTCIDLTRDSDEDAAPPAAVPILPPAVPAAVPAAAAGDVSASRPLLLLLSGLPGAGKSHFADALVAAGGWTRVCQDEISNGRPGQKAAVLRAAMEALRARRMHCVVDRTNLTTDQRAAFVGLAAALGVPLHAVHLATPREVCAERVRVRTHHPGDVTGSSGLAVIGRLVNLGVAPPSSAEGYDQLTTAASEASADLAAARYAAMPPARAFVTPWEAPGSLKALEAALNAAGAQRLRALAAAAPKPPNAFAALREGARSGVLAAQQPPTAARGGSGGGWAAALAAYADDPTAGVAAGSVLAYDAHVVVVRDKFPKARLHLLLVARDRSLDSVADLRANHLPLLAHMHSVAESQVTALRARDSTLAKVPVRLGFHAVPSMRRLHLHIISADLQSEALKTLRHFNSFTVPSFFISLAVVQQALAAPAGRVDVNRGADNAMMATALRCHRCGACFASGQFAALKSHIGMCVHALPRGEL